MGIFELMNEWEKRIFELTDQISTIPESDCERLLIKEERDVLIRCLNELKNVEL